MERLVNEYGKDLVYDTMFERVSNRITMEIPAENGGIRYAVKLRPNRDWTNPTTFGFDLKRANLSEAEFEELLKIEAEHAEAAKRERIERIEAKTREEEERQQRLGSRSSTPGSAPRNAVSNECQRASKVYERALAQYESLPRDKRTDEMRFLVASLAYDADVKCGDL